MALTTKDDISGSRFGRLVLLKFIPNNTRYAKYLCRCDCGVEKIIDKHALTNGNTLSCGCFQKDNPSRVLHGHSGKNRTKTYNSWAAMMDRCHWGGHALMFARYGAIGVRVTPKWHDFAGFLEDMGERLPGTSIDRIDNNKGYEPGNCRWATRQEQALNTSLTIFARYKGVETTVYMLCDELGISRKALRSRAVRRGNDYSAAFKSIGFEVETWKNGKIVAAQSGVEPVYVNPRRYVP